MTCFARGDEVLGVKIAIEDFDGIFDEGKISELFFSDEELFFASFSSAGFSR